LDGSNRVRVNACRAEPGEERACIALLHQLVLLHI
jgi:hypothetical protein